MWKGTGDLTKVRTSGEQLRECNDVIGRNMLMRIHVESQR